jgi:hypothetical protein
MHLQVIPIFSIRLHLVKCLNIKELGRQAFGILVNYKLALNFELVGTSCLGHTQAVDMMAE